ncbi:hypothetical protein FCT18_22230 [Lysinibacillus sphaericus]|uniref:Antigen I/II N-terminal domain-containing protein n=1 Tax=Lysinibacillus sphaericus TaxID=1421 RepID=A0A2S0JZX4_LYSSH|nr:hypothetical protein [Lysinibacillus sphaericus]AVK96667.1 hypothetical protein LS41612_10495 [Lysinibacillus sphaericus]MED4545515.1 hypothetical protein [Lysinibacillus sphaericus]TKI15948.1 hypothetical protein FCT18_22230 [Lysinibacillus sphaericus]SUV17528.1 Uncharacterised protein [Lysinibacillus sphaericus]GEC84042.1 hypothetical protein LSP03_37850 [Lysinibacillus sphaericus]
MKKILVLPLLLLFGIIFAGCSADSEKESGDKEEVAADTTEKTSVSKPLKVDKELLNVEVTIPADFFEDEDIDTVIADAKDEGIQEVIKNDDGSLTFRMSESQQKEILKDMEEEIIVFVEEIETDEQLAIKDISYNNTYSEFTILVNPEELESTLDMDADVDLVLMGIFYQLFNGVDPAKNKVTVTYKNESNGEVIDTIVYPDDLNEQN